MGKLIDLTGKPFGRLTAMCRAESEGRRPVWLCICECGEISYPLGENLRGGLSNSCGCLRVESLVERSTTHGNASRIRRMPEYSVYCGMKNRCFNKNDDKYRYWGGRGISVCNRWLEKKGQGFLNFFKDMGKRPSKKHSLDRIDNDEDYSPENCRWATPSEQSRNTRVFKYGERVKQLGYIETEALEYFLKYHDFEKGMHCQMCDKFMERGIDPSMVIHLQHCDKSIDVCFQCKKDSAK